jgi:hypothetical protein
MFYHYLLLQCETLDCENYSEEVRVWTALKRQRLFPFPQPPRSVQYVQGALSSGVKRTCREDDHTHPCTAEAKMNGHTPPHVHTHTLTELFIRP